MVHLPRTKVESSPEAAASVFFHCWPRSAFALSASDSVIPWPMGGLISLRRRLCIALRHCLRRGHASASASRLSTGPPHRFDEPSGQWRKRPRTSRVLCRSSDRWVATAATRGRFAA